MPEPNTPEPNTEMSSPESHNQQAASRRLDMEQMVSLIDSILPFEACLFHQVIPLSIEAKYLNLGMVDPSDRSALDYVRRQVSYIQYSVVSWPISSDWHRQILSKYLSHAAKAKQRKGSLPSGDTPVWPTPTTATPASEQLTFVVDSPTEIIESIASAQDSAPPQPTQPPSLPSLDLAPPADLGNTITDLTALSPKSLTQVLVQQVISTGIGRLYFERQAHSGKILCSQDGVVQSVIDNLDLDLFQSVINELKRLTHLPLLPVTATKQVEIEQLYRQERVLLRLRLIAGNHGEEATLQVLRGAALKLYQQQQIEQLSREALTVAQTLQQRIHALCDHSGPHLRSDQTPTTTLLAVSNLLKAMDLQIHQMLQSQKNIQDPKV